jgi:hypothetical protein
MSDSPNYPDVLGLITGGQRCNLGAAQVAVAVRPRVVRAGRPFEIIALVQNASDTPLDVVLTLHLPGTDAKRQRDRFVTKSQRLVVTVKGAETGYVVLPVTTLADTAVSDAYKIGVEFDVKALGKGSRIRTNEGGGLVPLEMMRDETRAAIDALKPLAFYTSKQMMRSLIEVPVTVMSGSLGALADFTPGWVSLANVSDYGDSRLLLHFYGPTVQVNTLPKLKRSLVYKPLLETTQGRFAEAGYPLKDGEATAIAKLMTLVLEYATPRFNAHGNIAARNFDVEALLMRDPSSFDAPPVLPYWFRGFLGTLEQDERAATYPEQVIPRYLYDALLRDAADLGFDLVNEATGEDLGSAEEQALYREQITAFLAKKSGLDFNQVYLPLVMGGLLVNDQIALQGEPPTELLHQVSQALQERFNELRETDHAIYAMTNTIIARAGQRFGFYLGS